MNRINILNINLIAGRTGAAQLVNTITNDLPTTAFSYHILVWYNFWNDNHTSSIYKTNNSRLYKNIRYKWAVGLNFLFDRMTPWHINMKYLKNLKNYQEADIIHLHSIQWGYFDRKELPTISKEKIIIMTVHDDRLISGNDKENNLFPYKTYKSYKQRKEILKNCKMMYIWVSNRTKNKLRKDWITANNKMKTIYNGINTNIFFKQDKKKCRDELELPEDKTIIISIAWSGNKSKLKWLEYVKKIIEAYKKEGKYLFITIWNHASKKISDSFWEIWRVDHEKVGKYFNASDIFLYPTLADNCPLTVLEAISCWLPVLSFNTWWVTELVEHKKNGYIAPYKDYEELKKWFEWIVKNKNILEIKLDNKFTQKSMVNQYMDLYQSLIQKK